MRWYHCINCGNYKDLKEDRHRGVVCDQCEYPLLTKLDKEEWKEISLIRPWILVNKTYEENSILSDLNDLELETEEILERHRLKSISLKTKSLLEKLKNPKHLIEMYHPGKNKDDDKLKVKRIRRTKAQMLANKG
jgi:DNA-directed RNA polymerase subunit RPC12/RpoP